MTQAVASAKQLSLDVAQPLTVVQHKSIRNPLHAIVENSKADDTMEADYGKYLSSLYAGTSWSVARLSGGLVNTTLRATQTSPVQSNAPTSVILKHAKPYVEVAGPEWTFSTKRQVSLLLC